MVVHLSNNFIDASSLTAALAGLGGLRMLASKGTIDKYGMFAAKLAEGFALGYVLLETEDGVEIGHVLIED